METVESGLEVDDYRNGLPWRRSSIMEPSLTRAGLSPPALSFLPIDLQVSETQKPRLRMISSGLARCRPGVVPAGQHPPQPGVRA